MPQTMSRWDDFRADPVVQGERLRLATRPLPDLSVVGREPLPDATPAEFAGKPLASLAVAPEYTDWISLPLALGALVTAGVVAGGLVDQRGEHFFSMPISRILIEEEERMPLHGHAGSPT